MGQALRRFVKLQGSVEERNLLAKEISTSSPRGAAMVAAAFLDEFLMKLLLHHMEIISDAEVSALFDPDRPLGSFSSRIKLARALGICGPKTAHDLNLMRAIRNAFAHGLRKMNFETPEVRQLLHSLHVVHDVEPGKRRRARTLFFEATAMLSTHLNEKGRIALTKKRVPPGLGCFCAHLD
jgi:DNA-binding MltR family transcriptional regulator